MPKTSPTNKIPRTNSQNTVYGMLHFIHLLLDEVILSGFWRSLGCWNVLLRGERILCCISSGMCV